MSKKPLAPKEVRAWVERRWKSQHRNWFDRRGGWPLTVSLAPPTERQVFADPGSVREWVRSWSERRDEGEALWETRNWARLGEQRLPVGLRFASAETVARFVGQGQRWRLACERRALLLARWPRLAAAVGAAIDDTEGTSSDKSGLRGTEAEAPSEPKGTVEDIDCTESSEQDVSAAVQACTTSGLGRFFNELADYDEADFERLVRVLDWFLANPTSGLYIRELPIAGVDTKWLETRKRVVLELLGQLKGQTLAANLHDACGLKREPATVRLKVLCPQLRQATSGLCYVETTPADLEQLKLRPRVVLIVENQTTGWALPDAPGAVAFVKLGNAVGLLTEISWLHGVPIVYWGDIDTYGLAILGRARRELGRVQSVLMDEATLLAFREFWVRESAQHPVADFPEWTTDERDTFNALRTNRWGENVRLEQERLPWPQVWPVVARALQLAPSV